MWAYPCCTQQQGHMHSRARRRGSSSATVRGWQQKATVRWKHPELRCIRCGVHRARGTVQRRRNKTRCHRCIQVRYFVLFVVSSTDKISPILYIAIRFCVQKSGKFSSKRFAPMMSVASCKTSAPCIVTLSNVPLPMPTKVIFIAILYTFQGYFQLSPRSPSGGAVQ